MVPLALIAWVVGCFAVFYLTLGAAGQALRRLEERTLAATGERLEALWMERVPVRRLLYAGAAGALLAGVLAGLALHPAAGLLAAGSILSIPVLTLKVLETRRREAFARQLVDVLDSLVSSLRSGFALEQGLRLAASQSPSPMGQELRLMLRETELGATLEESLAHLAQRMPGPDLALFVSAVGLARETGGNLAEILGALASTVRKRQELEGKLKSLTAQGRMQGMVLGVLPVGLGLAMYLIQPAMMHRFLASPSGWALLGLGAGLEVLGLLWIRRIVRLDL